MLTVRIQEKNHSESIMVLKLKDGYDYGRQIHNLATYARGKVPEMD